MLKSELSTVSVLLAAESGEQPEEAADDDADQHGADRRSASDERAPQIARLSTSLPASSVPRMCPGVKNPADGCAKSAYCGSLIGRIGARIASDVIEDQPADRDPRNDADATSS